MRSWSSWSLSLGPPASALVRRPSSVVRRPSSVVRRLSSVVRPRNQPCPGPDRQRFYQFMRKLVAFIAVLLAIHVAFLFVRPSGAEVPATSDAVKVGIVFDVGGRGDKSFNDGAYNGAERALKELGAQVRFIEPGDGSDREAGLRLLAAEGMDLIIGVGFIFTDDITQLAREYPNTKFADVDYSVGVDKEGNP